MNHLREPEVAEKIPSSTCSIGWSIFPFTEKVSNKAEMKAIVEFFTYNENAKDLSGGR